MLDNTSSSSLRGMEIGLAPGQCLPPPSPNTLAAYKVKPLPPVPPRTSGSSQASTFSSETQGTLRAPEKSKEYSRETSVHGTHGTGPAVETQVVSAKRLPLPHEKFQQPQMMEPRSVSKLYQLFGAGRTLPVTSITPAMPTGHNPRDKIKQLLGVSVATEQDQGAMDVVEEVSPLTLSSDASSVYGQGTEAVVSPDTEMIRAAKVDVGESARAETPKVRTAISDVAAPVIEDALEPASAVSPTFEPWRHPSVSPVPIPAHLNIVKADSRSSSPTPSHPPPPTAVPKHLLPKPNRTCHRNGMTYNAGDYHDALRELAGSGPLAPSVRPPSVSSSNISPRNTTYNALNINSRPPTPRPPLNKRQSTFSDRSISSRVRVAPPVELAELELLKAATYKAPITAPYPSDRPSTPDTPHPQTGRWLSRASKDDSRMRRPSLLNRVWNGLPSTVPESPAAQSTPSRQSGAGRGHKINNSPPRLRDRILRMDGGRRKKPPPVPLKTFSSAPARDAKEERPLTPYVGILTNNNPRANPYNTPPSKLLSPLLETSPSRSPSHTSSHSISSSRMTIGHVVHTPRPAPIPPTQSSVFETEETKMLEGGEDWERDRTSIGTTVSVWAARTNELLGNRACEALGIKSKAERRRDDLRGKIRVGRGGGQVGEEDEGEIGGRRFTGDMI